jgi:UDP-N-acetyl-2-amino-2-deoxyglucuronate dehydrogenase
MYHYPAPISDRKIRFALVGCGRIAQNHFAAIKQHNDKAELVGVCDINSTALAEAVKTTGAKPYTTLTQMLLDSEADVFILTTPSGLHSDQAIEIARAGRSVITEKPMATKWEDGKRMVKACDDAGVRLFVVKQNRRNATLQLLKQALEKKRFGKIYMVNLNVFWTRPQSYYDQGGWRGRWEFDGGAFMNQASHYVDLISWLIGPLESLQAYTATLARDIEAEDSGVISLKWRNGALGSMNVTMLTYPKNLEGSITILGEKGTVKIGGVAVNEVLHWEFEDKDPDDKKIKEVNYETTSVYGFGHPLYYENVINVMRGDAEPETDGREGLKSLEVIIATYLSARDSKRIALPLDY